MQKTFSELLRATLRAAGVHEVYDLADHGVARLLAGAHRRIHGAAAAWATRSGGLRIGADGSVVTIGSLEDLGGAVPAVLDAARGGAGVELRLAVDPATPVDASIELTPADGWAEPPAEVIDLLAGARSPMVLAGPGVVLEGAVPGLHALAAAGSLGVLNTWGAKGVFDWRSRHHLATAGLQARDFELGGLAEADLVIATGVDPAEAPPELLGASRMLTVPPAALDPLAERWSRPSMDIAIPPLRAGLAAVTQDGWAATGGPLQPTRVTRHYGVASAGGGLVAADPGVSGYWVARTFATTELGGVQVPADASAAGFAVACGVVARLRDRERPVLAVVDGPVDPMVEQVVEAGRSLGIEVPIEVWASDGESLDPDAHLARLRDLVAAGSGTVTVATDPAQLARMIDVAGPVTAWGGLSGT
jgi:hypothetical protein